MLAVSGRTNAMSFTAFEVTKDIFGGMDMFECGMVDVLSEDVGDSSNIKACGTSKPIERSYKGDGVDRVSTAKRGGDRVGKFK
eukprot:15303016-Ditylum_brightwellii.AAC.1